MFARLLGTLLGVEGWGEPARNTDDALGNWAGGRPSDWAERRPAARVRRFPNAS